MSGAYRLYIPEISSIFTRSVRVTYTVDASGLFAVCRVTLSKHERFVDTLLARGRRQVQRQERRENLGRDLRLHLRCDGLFE